MTVMRNLSKRSDAREYDEKCDMALTILIQKCIIKNVDIRL